MKKSKNGILAIALLILAVCARYDSIAKDNELWTGYEWQMGLTDNLSLKIGEQVRFFRDITTVKQLLNDFGFKYSIFESLSATAFYRLRLKQTDPSNQIFKPYHEINLAASYDFDYKPVQFSYRLRYQKEFKDDKKSNEEYFRNRLIAETKVAKDFIPYVYGELFYRVNYHKGDRFDNYRLGFGFEFRMIKAIKLSAGYTYEETFNDPEPQSRNIFGLNANINLDKSTQSKRTGIID